MYIVNTRERLIESARALLWERGYVGTSPRAIQERAEAGQGSMYHHFSGKPDLALAAVRRSAEEMRAKAGVEFSGPGSALDRITVYLLRERAVLRGCPVGRLAQDPDIVADPALRAPLEETFAWLRERLAEVVEEGRVAGEFPAGLDSADTAAAIVATLQGGYVLARAADSIEPFDRAIKGVLGLLSPRTS